MTEKTTQGGNNRIQGYGLERPTANYALSSLKRFLGEEEAVELWNTACKTCEVENEVEDLGGLEAVFKCLSKEPGAIGVLGRSLVIRTVSYRTLNRKNHTKQEQA